MYASDVECNKLNSLMRLEIQKFSFGDKWVIWTLNPKAGKAFRQRRRRSFHQPFKCKCVADSLSRSSEMDPENKNRSQHENVKLAFKWSGNSFREGKEAPNSYAWIFSRLRPFHSAVPFKRDLFSFIRKTSLVISSCVLLGWLRWCWWRSLLRWEIKKRDIRRTNTAKRMRQSG